MNKIKIFILLFSLSVNCYPQNYYSKMYDIYNTWESAISIISYDSVLKTLYFTGDAQNPFLPITDSLHYNVVVNCSIDSSLNLKVNSCFGNKPYTFETSSSFNFNENNKYWSIVLVVIIIDVFILIGLT